MQTALSEAQIREFVADWYRKLDQHAPLPDLLPMVSRRELRMKLPETTLHDQSEFTRWYETVTRKFFDEAHTLKQVNVRMNGDKADVDLVVNWRARIWNPPDASSQGLEFDCEQSWVVKDDPGTDKPVIVLYDVKSLTPVNGSAAL
jgi:hypothetical protein